MQTLRKLVADIAPSDLQVLITGETSRGNSLLAEDIHSQHHRSKRDPVVVDCTSLSREIGSVQLMEPVAGLSRRDVSLTRGALETAQGNSIILEKVSAVNPELQSLILRFAETGHVQRIVAVDVRMINARLISTSNQNIDDLVETNEFRRDLFHRINAIQTAVPSLRERRDGIAELAAFGMDTSRTP